MLASQTDKRECVGLPTCVAQCVGIVVSCGGATPTLVFQKTLVRFLVGFPSPTNNLSFFTGADLRPSSPIPGHEGLRPPSWGCVVIRRGRCWFVSDIRCACAQLLYVAHRTSSGWDKTRDTARGFPAGTKWCGCSKKFKIFYFFVLCVTPSFESFLHKTQRVFVKSLHLDRCNDYYLRWMCGAKSPINHCFC